MNDVRTTLVDEALPVFDIRARHSRRIAAGPEAVWQALQGYDLSRDASLPTRSLFRLRGLPVPTGTLSEVLGPLGFTVLAERQEEEIVVGTFGRFWTVKELDNMANPADLDHFQTFDRPGWAKAVMAFRLEPLADGSTDLVTETRVRSLDDGARRRFAMYWALIGFFSGWIRRDLLSGIARKAEAKR